jgi:hypothetical protein
MRLRANEGNLLNSMFSCMLVKVKNMVYDCFVIIRPYVRFLNVGFLFLRFCIYPIEASILVSC